MRLMNKTELVKIEDLKPGDVVDLKFEGLEVGEHGVGVMLVCRIDSIYKSDYRHIPEPVIEAGDEVDCGARACRVIAIHGDQAWVETLRPAKAGFLTPLRTLTLIRKGKKA